MLHSAQAGCLLEGVVRYSNVRPAGSRLDELVDGHNFPLDAIQEASPKLVAPACCGI